MNKYPEWWNATITIYNRHEDAITQVVTWSRHVITNCFWKYVGNKVTIGGTVLETDDTVCRIPENSLFVEKFIWEQLPSDERADYFTLGIGDIIIKGDVDDIVNEYTSGHRSSDLMRKYSSQGCITVNRVSLNTDGGRNNPHYYVKGV